MIIGVISDTHGLLRKEVLDNLENCEMIIHAGDIGSKELIKDLSKIAKVEAIRGNCDKNIEDISIRERIKLDILGKKIYLIHNKKEIESNFNKDEFDIVISGHSHKLSIYKDDGIIYVNPGSVGPKRFKLPITMVKMYINPNKEELSEANNELIEFDDIYIKIIEI